MDEKFLEMLKSIVPQLGDNAMWVFLAYFVFDFAKTVLWGAAFAIWPICFYKVVKKIRETKSGVD